MGKLLFEELPLCIQPSIAKAIGLNEAIVLQQIHYWMNNKKSGKFIKGRKWIYNTIKEWREQFPFFSETTIWRTINNLEDSGLVESGNFNKSRVDRTKWYTINSETLEILHALIEQEEQEAIFQNEICNSSDREDATRQDGEVRPESNTESTSDTQDKVSESETPPMAKQTSQQAFDALRSASHTEPSQDAPLPERVDNGLIPILPEEHYLMQALNIERKARGYGELARFKTTKQRDKFRVCVGVFNGFTGTQVDSIISNGRYDLDSVINALDWRRKNNSKVEPPPPLPAPVVQSEIRWVKT